MGLRPLRCLKSRAVLYHPPRRGPSFAPVRSLIPFLDSPATLRLGPGPGGRGCIANRPHTLGRAPIRSAVGPYPLRSPRPSRDVRRNEATTPPVAWPVRTGSERGFAAFVKATFS